MIYTHPHKNPFLLNFVFCFILLLFSLNTSLKSVCTADIDMGGYSLINVGKTTYAPLSYPTVEYDGVLYVSPLVPDGVFANVPGVVDDCANNNNIAQYLIPQSALTTYCPEGSQRETLANSPSPYTLFIATNHMYTSDNGCASSAVIIHFPIDTVNVYYANSNANVTGWVTTGVGSYFGSPLCRFDDEYQ